MAQNPHGEGFKINCSDCHNSGSWQVNLQTMKFDHTSTGFELEGQHTAVACMDCHELVKKASQLLHHIICYFIF